MSHPAYTLKLRPVSGRDRTKLAHSSQTQWGFSNATQGVVVPRLEELVLSG